MEITEPDSEESSNKDISLGQQEDVSEEDELEDKEKEKPSELLIPITLDNGDVLMPNFSELDELVPPKWSIFHRACSHRKERRSSTSGIHLPSNSKPFSRLFLL